MARIVAEDWRVDGGDREDYCAHCFVEFNWKTKLDTVKHLHTCPVLIAKDLLTGAPV